MSKTIRPTPAPSSERRYGNQPQCPPHPVPNIPPPRPSALISHQEKPKNDDIRFIIRYLNRFSPEQVTLAKNVFRAVFMVTNPELFDGDDDK